MAEVIKLLLEEPKISVEEISKTINLTHRTVSRYISDLKNAGIVEREGPDNGGNWTVVL